MPAKTYLFDTQENHENLLPLSFTRPVSDFRVGIVTIKEKWEILLPGDYKFLPVDYLREKYGNVDDNNEEAIFIAGNLLPDESLCSLIKSLEKGDALVKENTVLAFRGSYEDFTLKKWNENEISCDIRSINYLFDLFLENHSEIRKDFVRITKGRRSQPFPDCTRLIGEPVGPDGMPTLFIEEGAEIECTTINLKRGPVYIGKNAVIMEGTCLRGPLAVCENTKIRMGAKIYGGTTFGPYCKIGGEIDNSVFFGYSNKAHDGYLGNAVIGEWCNIGAGVNASNLKNDYSKIRIWNYRSKNFMRTDLQFCGLIMGDHSKIGINCMLNTATVIGVGVNLHGSGFPRVFIPGFREGSPSVGFTEVSTSKFHDIAERVMARRGMKMDVNEKKIFEEIHRVEHS